VHRSEIAYAKNLSTKSKRDFNFWITTTTNCEYETVFLRKLFLNIIEDFIEDSSSR